MQKTPGDAVTFGAFCQGAREHPETVPRHQTNQPVQTETPLTSPVHFFPLPTSCSGVQAGMFPPGSPAQAKTTTWRGQLSATQGAREHPEQCPGSSYDSIDELPHLMPLPTSCSGIQAGMLPPGSPAQAIATTWRGQLSAANEKCTDTCQPRAVSSLFLHRPPPTRRRGHQRALFLHFDLHQPRAEATRVLLSPAKKHTLFRTNSRAKEKE